MKEDFSFFFATVRHVGPDLNISTTIGGIARDRTDITWRSYDWMRFHLFCDKSQLAQEELEPDLVQTFIDPDHPHEFDDPMIFAVASPQGWCLCL